MLAHAALLLWDLLTGHMEYDRNYAYLYYDIIRQLRLDSGWENL